MVHDRAGRLLVIRRRRAGRRYCVLPGGGVEPGESAADAAVRELREETGLTGTVVQALWSIEHADRRSHYFLVGTAGGTLRLGGPEAQVQSAGNSHEPAWIEIADLDAENLQPAELRARLVAMTAVDRS